MVQPYTSGRRLHLSGVFHLVRTIHLRALLRIRPLAELAVNMNDRNLRERLCAFIARFPVQIYQRIQKIVLKRTIVIESYDRKFVFAELFERRIEFHRQIFVLVPAAFRIWMIEFFFPFKGHQAKRDREFAYTEEFWPAL